MSSHSFFWIFLFHICQKERRKRYSRERLVEYLDISYTHTHTFACLRIERERERERERIARDDCIVVVVFVCALVFEDEYY